MGKHEAPPFRMIIQGGRLVPATPYDAERLDSYRNGMEVRVRLTEERDRVMVKKWWAILNRAVKECKTPWKTADEASEAIKLAIGVVNLTKTVGGDFLAYPKSLTELDDPELTDAVEQMIEIVYRVTGVDPAEWKKQITHIRDEETPSSPVDGEAAADAPPATVAADQPADEAEAGAGASEAADDQSAAPAPELTDSDRAFLVRVFKTMRDCVGPSVEDFTRAALIFKDDIPDKSSTVKLKARTIRLKLEECCGDDPQLGTVQAAKYLAGVIGVDEKDLA